MMVPNTQNNPELGAALTTDANAAIKNFLKNTPWPPVTNNDRAKMGAAIAKFKNEIQKVKKQAAKKAKGGAAAPPAAQLAAQQGAIGSQLPGIASYLPPDLNLNNVSFSEAIQSMQATVAQMETLVRNPVQNSVGGPLDKGVLSNTPVKMK